MGLYSYILINKIKYSYTQEKEDNSKRICPLCRL